MVELQFYVAVSDLLNRTCDRLDTTYGNWNHVTLLCESWVMFFKICTSMAAVSLVCPVAGPLPDFVLEDVITVLSLIPHLFISHPSAWKAPMGPTLQSHWETITWLMTESQYVTCSASYTEEVGAKNSRVELRVQLCRQQVKTQVPCYNNVAMRL